MKNHTKILSFIAISMLSACQSSAPVTIVPEKKVVEVTQAEIDAMDYGPYPTDYENGVKNWFKNNLKDPDSAKYGTITKPKKFYASGNLNSIKDYYSCGNVNAKNSYGGYAGERTYILLFVRGTSVVEIGNEADGLPDFAKACANAQ